MGISGLSRETGLPRTVNRIRIRPTHMAEFNALPVFVPGGAANRGLAHVHSPHRKCQS